MGAVGERGVLCGLNLVPRVGKFVCGKLGKTQERAATKKNLKNVQEWAKRQLLRGRVGE